MPLRRKSLLCSLLLPLLALLPVAGCGDEQRAPEAPGGAGGGADEYPAPYDPEGLLSGPRPALKARPDILLVLLEQWPRGAPEVHLDDSVLLGRPSRDVLLLDAVTPSPESSAALASVLTGRLPSRHGVSHRDPVPLLQAGYATLPEILKAQGYATRAFVGSERLARGLSLWQGADLEAQRVGLAEAGEAIPKWVASLRPDQPYFAILVADEATPPYGRENHVPRAPPELMPLHLRGGESEAAELFLHNRPGYAYLEDLRRRQGGEAGVVELRREVQRFLWSLRDMSSPGFDAQAFRLRAREAAHLSMRDWIDGLANALDERMRTPRRAPPIAVWTATCGTSFGEHGILGPGRQLYDEQIQIPLYIENLAAPASLQESASLVDLLPTLLDALGLPAPAGIDGVSLLPVARGQAHRAPVVSEEIQDAENTGDPSVRATLISVRSPRWKYIVRFDLRQGTVVEEAYAAAKDGGLDETKNLANERGTVEGVPFDDEMCRAIERVRDTVWGKQVRGTNAVTDGPYHITPRVNADRPRPCGK